IVLLLIFGSISVWFFCFGCSLRLFTFRFCFHCSSFRFRGCSSWHSSYCFFFRRSRSSASSGCFFLLFIRIVDFVEIHKFYHCHISSIACSESGFDDSCISTVSFCNLRSYSSEKFSNRFFTLQVREYCSSIVCCIFFSFS